jgi:hypothetical protein
VNHRLKITPPHYARIANGTKTFHVADSDHAFQMGDTVSLSEYDDTPINSTSLSVKGFTGADDLHFKIGFVEVSSRGTILSLLSLDEADQLILKSQQVIAKVATAPKAKTRRKG